jgi:hypothetical protein
MSEERYCFECKHYKQKDESCGWCTVDGIPMHCDESCCGWEDLKDEN